MKQHCFCTKSSLIYIGLWVHTEIEYFDSPLQCRYLYPAVLSSINHITFGTQLTLKHLYRYAIFPFCFKRQFPSLLCFHFLFLFSPFLFTFFPSTSANHGKHFHWSIRIECRVQNELCTTGPLCKIDRNDRFLCAFQHLQAQCRAVSKFELVLERRFSN